MLLSVSPMFTLAGFLVLGGIFYSAKTFFDYKTEQLRERRSQPQVNATEQ